MKLKKTSVWFLILASSCLQLASVGSVYAMPELNIGGYQLLTSKRVDRWVYEYTYKAKVVNTGSDAENAKAILSVISSSSVTVLDGELELGNVPSGTSIVISDTFTIRHNRLGSSFDASNLQWHIQADNLAYSQLPDNSKIVEDPDGGSYPVNQLLVSLKDLISKVDAQTIADSVGATIIGYFPSINTYQFEVSANSIPELEAIAQKLEADVRVELVATNSGLDNENEKTDLANLRLIVPYKTSAYDLINVEKAWAAIEESDNHVSPIAIGIIDSAIERKHQEFSGVAIESLSRLSLPLFADKTHGTSVAGIIGANNISATSTYISPHMNGILSGSNKVDYKLLLGTIGSDFGLIRYDTATTLEKIEKAIAAGATIINLSFGSANCGSLPSDAQFQKCSSAKEFYKHSALWKKLFFKTPEVLYIASAGNGYKTLSNTSGQGMAANNHLPGGIPSVNNLVTVGATSGSHSVADYSNYGRSVDIAAPGNVYAPLGNGHIDDYRTFEGTSAATPMVTGVAGLIKSISPQLSPTEIKQILIETGRPLENQDQEVGPLLDAQAAVCHAQVLDRNDQNCRTRFTKIDHTGGEIPANSPQKWNCILENDTGLLWEVKEDIGFRNSTNTYTWYEPDAEENGRYEGVENGGICQGSGCDTSAYVAQVNSIGLCGKSNWRLPTIEELKHAAKYEYFNGISIMGFYDSIYFTNEPSAPEYWSSTVYANNLIRTLASSFEMVEKWDRPNHIRLVSDTPVWMR